MTNDETHRATQSEIRQYVERWERLEAEKKDIADHQKEVMPQAKANGYDTAILKQVIARRKKSPEDLAEQEALLSMYEEAMG